ncbi:DUF4870 family protein [Hippea alviniae]|uniref:DUF4870 family protein n=1 Tax=Hippea alviniae TaxID=1279027 RepID=UPI0003B61FCA|nr:DUF4870 domain-containing protein [Hippea alviniae]
MTEELKDVAADEKNARIVYYLYLASLVVGITAIVGVIMAYVNKNEAADWVKTHYRFQIRTFWIGLAFGLVSALLCIVIIGYLLLIGVAIWFIFRCVKGLTYLEKKQPYPDPETWLV